MYKKWILISLFLFSLNISADDYMTVTVDLDTVSDIKTTIDSTSTLLSKNGEIALMRIKKVRLNELSHLMHSKFKRCPGFVVHHSDEDGEKVLAGQSLRQKSTKGLHVFQYEINQEALVEPLLKQVSEINLVATISKLSSFHNRYHTSETGKEAVIWLKSYWDKMTESRSDIRVDYYQHKHSPQDSVIVTIEGSELSDEHIIIGGHVDSIARSIFGSKKAKAPGADDNASGIATMTEVLRIVVDNNYRPKHTVKFMAYAAEEVGLFGSGDIAGRYKKENKKVRGVLQLDMTNYKGSEHDIIFMTDFTNKAQNTFLASLVDKYVKVLWTYDRCGYGCSDHASWTNNGFPASMPAEAKMRDTNPKIHSKRDTLDVSNGHAYHAVKFAKLALAYLIELDR